MAIKRIYADLLIQKLTFTLSHPSISNRLSKSRFSSSSNLSIKQISAAAKSSSQKNNLMAHLMLQPFD